MSWETTLGCDYNLFARGGVITDLGTLVVVNIGPFSGGCINYPAMELRLTKTSVEGGSPPQLCNRDYTFRYPVDITVTLLRKQRKRYKLLRVIDLISDLRDPISDCSSNFDLPMLFETCFGTTVLDGEIDAWLGRVAANKDGQPFTAI